MSGLGARMGERLKTTGNGKSLLLRAELQGTSPRRDVQKIWGEWGNPLLSDHMDAAVRWYLITCTSQMMIKFLSWGCCSKAHAEPMLSAAGRQHSDIQLFPPGKSSPPMTHGPQGLSKHLAWRSR